MKKIILSGALIIAAFSPAIAKAKNAISNVAAKANQAGTNLSAQANNVQGLLANGQQVISSQVQQKVSLHCHPK